MFCQVVRTIVKPSEVMLVTDVDNRGLVFWSISKPVRPIWMTGGYEKGEANAISSVNWRQESGSLGDSERFQPSVRRPTWAVAERIFQGM